MKAKNNWWLLALMVVFAVTRWPGFWPQELKNFSAAYAMAFCAGVYFAGRSAWWIPLVTLAITDVAINCYYYFAFSIDAFQPALLINYFAYIAIILLGRFFRPLTQPARKRRGFGFMARRWASWGALMGGGILGAVIFYVLTNTASWWFNPFNNPEYTKSWSGLLIALTKGTAGWPQTWEFFRNTLLSGGLFTGLFVGAAELTAEPVEDDVPEEKSEAEPETVPENSGA